MYKRLTDTLEHWGSRHLLSNAKDVAAVVPPPSGGPVEDQIGLLDHAMTKSTAHFGQTVYHYVDHHQQDLSSLDQGRKVPRKPTSDLLTF